MGHKKNRCITLLLLSLFFALTAVGEQKRDTGEEVPLRVGAAQGSVFLPEDLLTETPIDQLPISEAGRSILRRMVDQQRRPQVWARFFAGRRVPSCVTRFSSMEPGTDPGSATLPETLADAEIVLTGQIVDVVSGWDAHYSSVAQLATVRVEEVVRRSEVSSSLAVDREVRVLFRGGRVRVGGTEICHRPRDGFYRPVTGDRIVVAGRPEERGLPLFVGGYVFPLKDDGVQPQPYASVVEETRSYALTGLRESITTDSGDPEMDR